MMTAKVIVNHNKCVDVTVMILQILMMMYVIVDRCKGNGGC